MRVIVGVCDTGLLVAAALSGGCAGAAGILVSSWQVKTRPGGYWRTAAAAHTTNGRGLALARPEACISRPCPACADHSARTGQVV